MKTYISTKYWTKLINQVWYLELANCAAEAATQWLVLASKEGDKTKHALKRPKKMIVDDLWETRPELFYTTYIYNAQILIQSV